MSETTAAILIPALNEAENIGAVLDQIPRSIQRVIVCDNGSTDNTADVARSHGADVILETRKGYGSACFAAFQHLKRTADNLPEIVVFMDGDNSDDPAEAEALIAAVLNNRSDLVIGSRTQGTCEKGALTPTQRFGNWLSCRLTSAFFGVDYTDLGPFRAIRTQALEDLKLDDMGFGWTIQMQVRAARQGLRISEIPVNYRNRAAGRSKVSGSVRGVIGAGTKILFIIFTEAADAGLSSLRKGSLRARLLRRLHHSKHSAQ